MVFSDIELRFVSIALMLINLKGNCETLHVNIVHNCARFRFVSKITMTGFVDSSLQHIATPRKNALIINN